MRLSKLNLSKFLPAAIAVTTLSASSALAFGSHNPPPPTAPHPQGTVSLTPGLCNPISALVGDASASFVNISHNPRIHSLALQLVTTDNNQNGDLPYGYVKSSASPAFVDLQFDVSGPGVLDGSADLAVTVVDPVTTLYNVVFIQLVNVPLAATQTNPGFVTLSASAAFLAPFFVNSFPNPATIGSLFNNAAIDQGNFFVDTLLVQNVILNPAHGVPIATSVLVAPPGNDCSFLESLL